MDLPTSGYADNIDHRSISQTSAVDFNHNRAVPLVDYLEDFIVAFVDTLNEKVPNLKSRISAVVGGSLGGNMSMRLGRRHALRPNEDLSWIRAVVPWSPAAIWPSFANDASGGIGHANRPYAGVSSPLAWSGGDPRFVDEKAQRRRELFYGGFDWRPAGAFGEAFDPSEHVAQADLWWRQTWQCKPASKLAARLDRHETYDENFRRWHWREGAEQCLFSQQETIPPGHYPVTSNVPFAQDKKPPLYFFNTVPMFLSCGRLDVGGSLCAMATDVSRRMINTPGMFRLLENTGHSIDNERPNWFARQVVEFLGSPSVVCEGLSARYGIVPNVTFGTAPSDVRQTWATNKCDTYAFQPR
jgi:pimeloyl-ACP methyl ester carboxylesterase